MSVFADLAPGQALILSNVRDNVVHYKFRLYSGEEGDISPSTVTSLGLDIRALPVVINTEQLISVLYGNTVEFSNIMVNLMQKADTDFVKKALQTRVSIDKFREFIAKVPLTETYNSALSNKADLEYVNTALGEKVDRGQVYTIDKIHEILLQFLGARAVYDIAERDALEYAIYPFVWVLDASGDSNPNVKSPALYKWNGNHWVYLGTVGDFGTGGGGDFSNYYTSSEIDALLAQLVPGINGAEDNGKVITVALTTVNGVSKYKYVLADVQPFDASELQSDIALLKGNVNQISNRVSVHDSSIATNQNNISDLAQQVSDNATAINQEAEDRQLADTALVSEVDNIKSVVAEFKTQTNASLSSHEQTLQNHDTRITALEQSPGGSEVDLTPITNRLTAVEGRLTTVEETLGYVNTEVSGILSNEFDQEV